MKSTIKTLVTKINERTTKIADEMTVMENSRKLAFKATLPVTRNYIRNGIFTQASKDMLGVAITATTMELMMAVADELKMKKVKKTIKVINRTYGTLGTVVVGLRSYHSYKELKRIEKETEAVTVTA